MSKSSFSEVVSLHKSEGTDVSVMLEDCRNVFLKHVENFNFFFEQFLGVANGIMVAVDKDENIIFANETIMKLLEVTWEDIKDKKITDLKKDYVPVFCCVLAGKKSVKRVKKIEGNQFKRYFDITAIPIMIEDEVIGAISLGVDVTETALMERELFDSERIFLLGQMASRIMHDIRNPLQTVKSSVQVMNLWNQTGEMKPEKIKRMLVNIDVAVDNVIDLMNDMLQFSKPGTDKMGEVDLKNLVMKVGDLFSSTFSKNKIEFCLDVKDGCEVFGNKKLLRQSILNIVQNAVEVLRDFDDIRQLEIRCYPKDDKVMVEIFNTGPLIDDSIKIKIFDTFFSTKGTNGTGLGLAITKEIIEQIHEGKIWCVSSQENKGTSFMIEISKIIK